MSNVLSWYLGEGDNEIDDSVDEAIPLSTAVPLASSAIIVLDNRSRFEGEPEI